MYGESAQNIMLITSDTSRQFQTKSDIKTGNFKRVIIVSPAVTYGINIDHEYDAIFCYYANCSIDAQEQF